MNERATITSPLSKERLRVWLRLLKATRAVEAELRERMRLTFGTTLPRFDMMAALARARDGLRMSELSAALRVSNGNVTGLVERLVADGWARREAVAGDRRASRVHLTAEGRRRFEEMAAIHEAWVDELLSPIGAAGLETILTRLGRITEHETARETGRGGDE